MAIRALKIEFHAAARLGYMSAATAPGTSFQLADQSFAATVRAGVLARDLQAHYRPADGIPEAYVNLVFEIRSRRRFGAAGLTPATKDVGEDVMQASATTSSPAACAPREIVEIKSSEIKGHALSWPGSSRCCAETPRSKPITPRIGLGG